ncbi:glutamate receptor ionotropic, kainate glr-3-like [Eriocheir sinensis]|uniref:glutamate receptor ionotropic, kainate glr-3-like n=1 Tax=Eriocheir sinensis TaxID=95602 RepID=UPI0021C72E92|nr:glutamate receptor ionotropic, kainate glr-3-like [Eriocheir sinensis]
MVGMCERGEVDFALGPMGINIERAEVMDFSALLFMDQQIIAYKRPKLQPELAGFIRPFTVQIWAMIALGFITIIGATSFFLITLSKLQYSLQGIREKDGGLHGISHIIQIATWAYGLMLTQPMGWFPGTNTGRLVGGVWLLSSLIIAIVYRSNLKAMLIIPKVNLPFNNLEEMVAQDEMPFILMGGSVVYNTLKEAPEDSLFGRAWKRRAGEAWTYQEGLKMILQDGNAIIVDKTTVQSILHTSFSKTLSCPLWLTREAIVSYVLSLGFPKNSALKSKMDPVIRRLGESGLINYWMRLQLLNATYCLVQPGTEPSEQRPLQLQDFYGIFFLLIAGECLSLTVFLCELGQGKEKLCDERKIN